jgi:hypothetical protein
MRVAYSFSVLRYVHDPVTQEFLNIGVAVYSPDARFLRAICATGYERITRVFARIDGNRFRQTVRYIQEQINGIGSDMPSQIVFEPGLAISKLLAKVLPIDDSSFQFSDAGVGLSGDLEGTLAELFERYVEQYVKDGAARREDEDVWKVFREPLERKRVAQHLVPKKIATKDYEYEFNHSWKNKVWHLYEPVSFDLLQASSILEKANRWVGRATTLMDSTEKFKLHILLGEPRDTALRPTFEKARNILDKIPAAKEVVAESEAEDLAEKLARDISKHS